MTIAAKRRENETVEKLIHRFKKQTQSSRLVPLVRKLKHWSQAPSKRLIRQSALKREENRARRRSELLT